jgi:hypothetical protein
MKKNEFDRDLALLLDRTSDVRAVCDRIAATWRYDLTTRKVGGAYEDDDGVYRTDLDLACYMAAIAEHRGTIVLPEYRTRRAATRTAGEVIISKDNRHGRVIGLTSNADVFSFNVLIEDANVMTADSVGKPRNFMLQDLDGTWHDGWKVIRVMPSTPEEKKLFEGTNGQVSFKYFVHPNRWTSFYGRAYLLAKVAEKRLEDQDRFLKSEAKRIRDALGIVPEPWPKTTKVGDETSVKVEAFNAEVDGVVFTGDFEGYPTDQPGLSEISILRHRIGELLRTLRFHIRATEFAFYSQSFKPAVGCGATSYLVSGGVNLELPSWAKGGWTCGYKESAKARNHWAKRECESGLSIRFRVWEKTEKVAAD